MVGQAFALQPGLREKFQIVYKVRVWLLALIDRVKPRVLGG